MAWDDIPEWASSVANAILMNVKQKDPFTFYHCCRVGRAARRLAQSMGLNEYEQNVLEFSGLFHDIGKVGIPDNILLKPARLDDSEYKLMKAHPVMSAKTIEPLSHIAFFKAQLPGIRYHHERVDGVGYPFNLKGDKIPLAARIIAIVDTVDAMMFTRPYRKGMPFEVVKQELLDFSGTQFDKAIVDIYLDAVRFWNNIESADKEEVAIKQILLKSA